MPAARWGALRCAIVVALAVGCGTDEPTAKLGAYADPRLQGGDRCATPNEACPCDIEGQVVQCGQVELKTDSYVTCSDGKRTCAGGVWGQCLGEHRTTQSFTGHGIRILALGAQTLCGTSNLCDPYCQQFTDTPDDAGLQIDGAVTIDDGGISIIPTEASSDAGTPPGPGNSVLTPEPPNGMNTCAGSHDVVSDPPCSADPYKKCGQDFHCDATLNQCVWNVPLRYTDPACNGADLEINAGCDVTPPATGYSMAVCNRGTVAIPTGKTLTLNTVNSTDKNDWIANCTTKIFAAATCSHVLTAPLGPGQCVNVVCNTRPNGQRWVIVNGTGTRIAECGAPGGGCKNNMAQVKDNGSGCGCLCRATTATLTGRIMDPQGARPIYGATVFIPSTPVSPFAPGVACDTCSSLISGNPTIAAVTAVDGTFRLEGVPANVQLPVVVQLGRWRRQVTVPAIAPCGTAALPAAKAHLPRMHVRTVAGSDEASDTADPDIPQIAIVTAGGDSIECLMRSPKIGLADSEFTSPTGTGRIHMYRDATGSTAGGRLPVTQPDRAALYGDPPTMGRYQVILAPCNLPQPIPGDAFAAGWRTNMLNWANAGGRLFTSHWGAWPWIENEAPWTPYVLQDRNNDMDRGYALDGIVNTGFPTGAAFATWLVNGGFSAVYGHINITDWRHLDDSTVSPVINWITARSNVHNIVLMYNFDTPIGAAAGAQCGRVVEPQMHVEPVAAATLNAQRFPTYCNTAAVVAQEAAFEFMLFNLMTCLSDLTIPPPPPPPPPAMQPVTITREYHAVCPSGTLVEWQTFEWQAVIPTGTEITFSAQTAEDVDGAAPSYGTAVDIGTATTTTAAWTSDGSTVDQHLRDDGQISRDWLKVTMTLTPTPSTSPILQTWQQNFDCLPKL